MAVGDPELAFGPVALVESSDAVAAALHELYPCHADRALLLVSGTLTEDEAGEVVRAWREAVAQGRDAPMTVRTTPPVVFSRKTARSGWRAVPSRAMTTLKPFIALAEKAVLTFLQVLLTAYLASGALGFEGADIWIISGVAAAGTVIANGLPELNGLPFGLDLLYRVARTYAVGFLTLFLAPATGVVDLSVSAASAAAWAALPAAITIVKGAIASKLGEATPALLPASADVAPGSFALAA